MKKIIFVSVCLVVFFYSNTAFGGALDQLLDVSGGGSGNRPDVGPPERGNGAIIDFLPPPDFPLLEAVKNGDIKKVKSILKAQEAYKKSQAFQDLKANIAARQGDAEYKEAFLKEVLSGLHEDEINKRGFWGGDTPLSAAALDGNLKIVKLLIEHGAEIDRGKENGDRNRTPLIEASDQGHVEVVKYLISKGADVNGKSGGYALINAVLNKKTEVVSALLKHGASVNEKYNDENTALMMAVNEGSSDIAKLLIAHKADVNAVDKDEITALMIASEKGNFDMVEALLEAGADVNKKSKDGNSALIKAISANHVQIVRTLVKNSGNFNKQEALFSSVGKGNLEIVKLLLTKDTDENMSGFAGGSLLMLAADRDFAILKFLVERGADVNKKDDEGKTALMKAVESFYETNIFRIKFLIDHGADVNAINNKGETALILATKSGNADIVRVLLAKGSSASPKDKEEKSAWTYAVEGANPDVVTLLEKAGAVRDYKGMEWEGDASKEKTAFIKVVETQEEWSELWKRAFDKPAPDMDFEKYLVACVFLGHSADWEYDISFGKPYERDNLLVITYGLSRSEIRPEMTGPFEASGQYHMKVFEKKKDVKMILEKAAQFSRWRQPAIAGPENVQCRAVFIQWDRTSGSRLQRAARPTSHRLTVGSNHHNCFAAGCGGSWPGSSGSGRYSPEPLWETIMALINNIK